VLVEGTYWCPFRLALVTALLSYTMKSRSVNPFVLFVWPITVFSIVVSPSHCRLLASDSASRRSDTRDYQTCRLIMKLRTLKTERQQSPSSPYQATGDIPLTSVFFEVDGEDINCIEFTDLDGSFGRCESSMNQNSEVLDGRESSNAPAMEENGDGTCAPTHESGCAQDIIYETR